MLEFPKSLPCILQDNFKNRHNFKHYLGGNSHLFKGEIDFQIILKDDTDRAIYKSFIQDVLKTKDKRFLLNIPLWGSTLGIVELISDNIETLDFKGTTSKVSMVVKEPYWGDYDFIMRIEAHDKTTEYAWVFGTDNKNDVEVIIFGDTNKVVTDGFDTHDDDSNTDYRSIIMVGDCYIIGKNIVYHFIDFTDDDMDTSIPKIIHIDKSDRLIYGGYMFYNATGCEEIHIAPGCFDNIANNFNDFTCMAYNTTSLKYISPWRLSEGAIARNIFSYSGIDYVPDMLWGNAVTIAGIFEFSKVTKIPDLHLTKCSSASYAFANCPLSGEQGEIHLYDIGHAVSLTYMFYECNQEEFQAKIIAHDVMVDCDSMFMSSSIGGLHFDAKITNAHRMFEGCDNISCISGRLDTTGADDKEDMFKDCDNLDTPNSDDQDALMSDDGADWTNDSCS